jgi:hypothetical protein
MGGPRPFGIWAYGVPWGYISGDLLLRLSSATRPECDGYLLFLTPSPGHGYARTSYTYRFSRAIGITMWYPWDVQGMHQSITIIPFH